jgi:sugar phosphate isomerase/epimerase
VRFGFSTFFFPQKPLVSLIDELVAYGLTAIELVYDVPHFDQFDDNLIAHLKRLSDRDVRFSLHCPFLEVNLSGYFEEVRSFSRQLTEKAVDFAARAGCNPVVIHPGYTFLMNKVHGIEHVARSYMIDALAPLAAFATRHGITLGLENLQMPYFLVHDLKDFLFFKSAVPQLGLVFDLGHAYIMKRRLGSADPEGAVLQDIEDIGVDNVIHVHLSNNTGLTDEHGFINGDIDIKRVVRWLHERGYQGRLIIESTEVESLGIPAVLARIREIEPKE